MDRNLISRVLNLVLYLTFCLMAATGWLLAYRLPHGRPWTKILGMNRHGWSDLHLWVSYVFILAVVVHLLMNWQWLKKVAAPRHRWLLWLSLLTGAALVLGLLLLPMVRR